MKDRSLNVEEKNRRLEKVKLKQQEQPNLMVNAVKETRLNAESKAMGDTNKAAKVEKESAMQ